MAEKRKYRKKEHSTTLNRVELIRGGSAYFSRLIEMIDSAANHIHLQTYIYDDDETGTLIAEHLKRAVNRNVDVYLLVDGYASRLIRASFLKDLTDAGIRLRFFEPLFKSHNFYFGRRMHQKVVVTDSRFALVGGVNISNRYNDMPGAAAWLDFALFVEGEAARELCILCWKTWNNYPARMERTPCEKNPVSFDLPPETNCEVSVRRNDWVRRKNEISSTYTGMLRNASKDITILCSYFLPGRVIRRHLGAAAKRGVKIRIITAGVSDVKVSKYAERYLYDWMLRNKMELYEYQPAVLHGKIAVCDSRWMTIGSYNINNLSAYASIELNMNVINEPFALEVERVLNNIIKNDCRPITTEYHKKSRNLFKQFIRWLSYQFLRLLVYLFTFYFKRR